MVIDDFETEKFCESLKTKSLMARIKLKLLDPCRDGGNNGVPLDDPFRPVSDAFGTHLPSQRSVFSELNRSKEGRRRTVHTCHCQSLASRNRTLYIDQTSSYKALHLNFTALVPTRVNTHQ